MTTTEATRSSKLALRMRPATRRLVEAAAQEHGLTLSRYAEARLRQAALADLIDPPDLPAEAA